MNTRGVVKTAFGVSALTGATLGLTATSASATVYQYGYVWFDGDYRTDCVQSLAGPVFVPAMGSATTSLVVEPACDVPLPERPDLVVTVALTVDVSFQIDSAPLFGTPATSSLWVSLVGPAAPGKSNPVWLLYAGGDASTSLSRSFRVPFSFTSRSIESAPHPQVSGTWSLAVSNGQSMWSAAITNFRIKATVAGNTGTPVGPYDRGGK